MQLSDRGERLKGLLRERVLVIDGAMGTQIQARALGPADFGGPEFEGCNEHLNLTLPDVILEIHRAYLEAGADIVETNSFGSTALVLAEYPPLHERAYEITRRSAELARQAADEYTTLEKPRFVAGAMGPTTKAISVTGGVTFEQLVANYREQARGLVDGGADYLLLETSQDTRNVKAGLLGIRELFREAGWRVPVAVSGTIEPMGTMLAGQTVEALVTSLEHEDLLYIGLNCATGPDFMTDHIRSAAGLAAVPVACVPNAGLPDENGRYLETPLMIAGTLQRFIEHGWVNLVGGCCGTTPEHIAAIAEIARGRAGRVPAPPRGLFLSGLENLDVVDTNRPVIVGERTNVIGSRQFKRLIAEGKFEEASEIARAQVKGGAQVIDVCLADPDRDELADMERFMGLVVKKAKAPLMVDSTDPAVIERALTYSQGKAIINSINLEDGEERFERVVPLGKRYGAAFVVGCIDEQGMAVTAERKLEVARRSHDLLAGKYGVRPTDLVFDPLTFPCATGDAQYLGSAQATVDGIRLIERELPECKTILGVSNVSFGLPPAGREVMNSVFLYHCVQAGLDMAIVNAEKLERYASIPEEERRLAEEVLFRTSDEAIAAFTARFRGAEGRTKKQASRLSLDERLANYLVEGSKDGLYADLDLKLREAAPLDIINGPLMAGMDEVGRLFNANQLIVAEVLQSAEAMKAAVAHLEPHMEKADVSTRGTIVLATVKGDVHDIGKNLVEIILGNNGYRVINLGIKVPPQDLIQAVQQYQPDMIGLSGLLVKSAQQMVVTAEELAAHGVKVPILVGGAALTNSFTRQRIAPAYGGLVAYAKEAMQGLGLANRIMDAARREQLVAELAHQDVALAASRRAEQRVAEGTAAERRSAAVPVLAKVPEPPDYERHVLRSVRLDEVWAHLNPTMLYGKHLGLRGGKVDDLLARGDERAMKLWELVDRLKAEGRAGKMEVSVVYQFFPAASEGNTLRLLDHESGGTLASFWFPRQSGGEGLCLSDFVNPVRAASDNVCLFVVTAGRGIRVLYEEYRDRGEFLLSHGIQALALETAEAAAEWLHAKLRGMWGFPDDPEMEMRDRFQARYRGKRYSFGYPACPDMALQAPLFELLRPDEIGVTLTEGFMMEPEASVSAVVVHHPAARYFGVEG